MADGEGVCQKFGDNLTVGNEVDKRDVGHLDEITAHDAGNLGKREFVADHLRNQEQGRLEGGGATGDESSVGLCQQGIGLIIDHLYPTPLDEGVIVVGINARGSGEDDTIVLHVGFHGLNHCGEVVLDLLTAGAGKEGNDLRRHGDTVVRRCEITICLMGILVPPYPRTSAPPKLPHFIRRGITHIMNGIVMLLLEEIHLEGQDGEELVNIATDVLDAVLLPSPDLWRDVIIDGNVCPRFYILCNLQIEAGIIYQYDAVRLPGQDILLAELHIP